MRLLESVSEEKNWTSTQNSPLNLITENEKIEILKKSDLQCFVR